MKKNRTLLFRVIRVILMVIVGLALIAGIYHVLTNKQAYLSPGKEKCVEKIWCLDYDTVAQVTLDCVMLENDCDVGDRCSSGTCVKN